MFWKTIFIAFMAAAVLGDENQLKPRIEDECNNDPVGNFNTFEETAIIFDRCLKSAINLNDLQQEIKDAKTKAAVSQIFQRHCEKKPQLMTCVHTSLDALSRCEDASVQSQIVSAKNISDQIFDFVCYNHGEKVIMFLAEKGSLCYQSKTDDITACLNQVKEDNAPSFVDSKNLSIQEKCTRYDQFSSCIVGALKNCDTPVAANTFESLLKSLRVVSPCNNLNNQIVQERQPNGAVDSQVN
ncbi:hypothetical protein K1T71_004329 [Dendrolimus kikuchii]|uniref:Uncharacterized protein n=1 Tax=Dendrolimus kikuchii TaxID=765133 RepID=A0ACC1D743_9NEOP|nr:hypothetical protein K1T71_004329 [Dendrolimus kikuchii]